MQKVTLVLFILFTSTIFSHGQKIMISDLKEFASKSTDEVAEKLLNKRFELHAYPQGKEFVIEKGQESISIDFKDNDPFITYKLVRLCYSEAYNKDYENLVSQIKSQGKKLSFFYSTYHTYMTEYLIGNNLYVYVCKGICESLDHKTKFGSLFISNQSIKNNLQ